MHSKGAEACAKKTKMLLKWEWCEAVTARNRRQLLDPLEHPASLRSVFMGSPRAAGKAGLPDAMLCAAIWELEAKGKASVSICMDHKMPLRVTQWKTLICSPQSALRTPDGMQLGEEFLPSTTNILGSLVLEIGKPMAESSMSDEILLAAHHMAEDRKTKELTHVSRTGIHSVLHLFSRHRRESFLKGPVLTDASGIQNSLPLYKGIKFYGIEVHASCKCEA